MRQQIKRTRYYAACAAVSVDLAGLRVLDLEALIAAPTAIRPVDAERLREIEAIRALRD